MSESHVLLESYLKTLRLPSFVQNYQSVALNCQKDNIPYDGYLQKLGEIEVNERYNRNVTRRLKKARFPALKSLDSFDFQRIPTLNKQLISELSICEYIKNKNNIVAIGNSGIGKTHIAIALGISACQQGYNVGYYTAANLVNLLIEAHTEKELLRLQKRLSTYNLLIIDELGYLPLSKTGAELLFDIFSQRYEQSSIIITSNLPFPQWTEIFGCERLTGALLDRFTHHVHILNMSGDSYRLQQSKEKLGISER